MSVDDVILEHYGIKRRSGRYPWGSGEDPYQRSKDFLAEVDKYRKQGMGQKDIAEVMGITVTQLRTSISWANKARKEMLMDSVESMSNRGMTNTEIAAKLGITEGTVRNYKTRSQEVREDQLENTVDILKERLTETPYLDVGVGVERQMGISKEKLKAAVAALQEEGYYEHEIYVKRLDDPMKWTTVKVLSKESDVSVIKQNQDQIRSVDAWTEDGGISYQNLKPVQPVSWDRISIAYDEDGGSLKDGVIELRRGVNDLDLDGASYAQVRIQVGDGHYLKGMALYSDDLPEGVDIRFNTNKSKTVAPEKVLKPLKENPDGTINTDNPFGATITRQRGALNILNEEGDWNTWAATLSTQFMSKQPDKLVKDRLDVTYESLLKDFDEINSLTNPTVKRHLMQAYADGLDAKAKHMKVQGLPNTKGHVILPFTDMNPNEVYAPNYKDGDKVVLLRYPHGGIFELAELTVNNKGPAKDVIGQALDGIGIHPSVASKLSGADFDGDTVYVIPNNNRQVKTSRSLAGLKDFDPHSAYPSPDGKATITKSHMQTQMGVVSNLINDMTIKDAPDSELARAVRHSMVVIDSEKHKLDYKKSAIDNGISALQKKYQTHIGLDGREHMGASTLISKASTDVRISGQKVKKSNPITGKNDYYFITDDGKEFPIKSVKGLRKFDDGVRGKVSIIDYVGDAHKLSSGTSVENLYADYSNKVVALKNKALKTAASITDIAYNKDAAVTYKKEVDSLNAKLNTALLNAPKERLAQIRGTTTYYKKVTQEMDAKERQRLAAQSIAGARTSLGMTAKVQIKPTPKEWEAVQAGAISKTKLQQILTNSDQDYIKQLATPKNTVTLSPSKQNRAKVLLARGYSYAEVADAVGVSTTTIRNIAIE